MEALLQTRGCADLYAYNECGERALVYEDVTSLGFDSGSPSGYAPATLNDALQIAFTAKQASQVPAAIHSGFKPTDIVVQYPGDNGYILDIHGVEVKIGMDFFVTNIHGVSIKTPKVGNWQGLGLHRTESGKTFELGVPTFSNSIYYLIDWDHKQMAFTQASDEQGESQVEAFVEGGIPGATTAPHCAETQTQEPKTYSTNIFRATCAR